MEITRFVEGNLQTNVYVIENHDECIVIDPAYDEGKVKNYIREKELKLMAVMLTHGHFDHCGGVATLIADIPRHVPVYCSYKDFMLAFKASENDWAVQCENCIPDMTLVEGLLDIGSFHFKVLETPGHTPGSVCLIYGDVIFTGDTLFKLAIGRTDFPESSEEQMKESLSKLNALKRNYAILPGHGEPTKLTIEKNSNPWLLMNK
ncbi:MAG: MBL fold metallo-hydrolase [Corallococcus sp.]|nr:MBL fold metallo-hydrolase [Corallococcus sp.]